MNSTLEPSRVTPSAFSKAVLNTAVLNTVWLAMFAFILGSASYANAQDFQAGDFVPPTGSGFEVTEPPAARTAELISPGESSVGISNVVSDAAEVGTAATVGLPSARRLTDLLRRGGLLMIPIGICSFILVVFVFERFISLRKSRIIPEPFTRKFLDQLREGQLTQNAATAICDRNSSAMANVFKAGVAKWGRPAVEVEQAVLDEGERTSNRLRKYLRMINGVATICPLLGLLGTVFGMIHAFDSIAVVNSVVADQAALTATGISQALLTTAAGLSVAIPALIAYLFFSSRVDKHVMEIDTLGMKVVNQISAEALAAKTTTRRTKKAA